jgi:hypothetical protein
MALPISQKERVLVAAEAIGFLAVTVAETIVGQVSSFSQVLQYPVADVVVVVVGLVTIATLVLWARQSGHCDRTAFVAAITAAGVLLFIANVFAPSIGWWDGTFFKAPLFILALMTAVGAMGLLALLLRRYLWLAARKPKLALLVYGLIRLVLLPASTIIGDLLNARLGLITFGEGYTVSHDVLVGEAFFWSPLILYKVFRRFLGVPEVRRPMETITTAHGDQ